MGLRFKEGGRTELEAILTSIQEESEGWPWWRRGEPEPTTTDEKLKDALRLLSYHRRKCFEYESTVKELSEKLNAEIDALIAKKKGVQGGRP